MSDKPKNELELPSPEDILSSPGFDDSETDDLQTDIGRYYETEAVKSEIAWAHLSGLQDHYKHKGRWSYFLMGLLTCMIAFQSALLWCVGLGVWDFTKYDWLLPALLVQNLGQIIALAYVVVKSLFRDLK
jgi:hypothetical protein